METTPSVAIAPRRSTSLEQTLGIVISALLLFAVTCLFVNPNIRPELESIVPVGIGVLLTICAIWAFLELLMGFIKKLD